MAERRRERDLLSIRDVLAEGRASGIDLPLHAGELWSRWREIVGEDLARHVEPTSLKAGVLRVHADSPTWATEVRYLGPEIVRRANEVIGAAVVRELQSWTGTGPNGRSKRVQRERAQTPDRDEPQAARSAPSNDPLEALERARKSWSQRLRRGRFSGREKGS
jgi:predicted nucleic acid-binding Zn ribbon protein